MSQSLKVKDLPIIKVKRVVEEKDAKELIGIYVPDLEPTISEAGIYIDEDTEEPFLAYFPLPNNLVKPLRNAVINISMGSVVRQSLGFSSLSRTFGMAPKTVFRKRESCRSTGLALESPAEHAVIADLAAHLSQYMKEISQDIYDHDKAVLDNVEKEWKIGEQDLWTSGVINQSASLPYHKDNFNFQTWSAMPVIRRKMDGGYFSMPEYGQTVACRDGWVLFMPGYKYVHGVTPMQPKADDGYRFSIVYYALKGMKDCFTAAVETANARQNRMKREESLAESLKTGNFKISGN
jgi:hypothetical protein